MFQLIVTWILPCSKWVIIKFINGFGKKQRSEHLKFTEINNAPIRQKITVAGQGWIQGAHPSRAPLELEKIWFFGVKSWFFTRNTPKLFAPPSARRNFFKCAPLVWNPASAPAGGLYFPIKWFCTNIFLLWVLLFIRFIIYNNLSWHRIM